jgi:drug/metabolite transporter (DMT)-like permease
LRYFLAFLILLPFFLLSKNRNRLSRLSRREWLALLGLGFLLYSVTQGAQFLALSYLPAVTVNLMWSFSPVAVAAMGILLLDERLARLQFLGVALATAGALLFFLPASFPESFQLGLLIALIGILANAGASILGRGLNRSRTHSPLLVTLVSMGFGALLLLVTGLLLQGLPRISWSGWLIILWLALVNTALAFTLWNFTLRSLSATESSVINGTMIIWIPVLAVLFLGEELSLKQVIGLIAAGAGTMLVQLRLPGWLDRTPKIRES